jgi:site-specific DNA-methyltransferase (adenine-specific)
MTLDLFAPKKHAPTLHHGDCLAVLRTMPDASVDSVVTDPPAGIAFMGKAWDEDKGGRHQWIAWMAEVMGEALRVIKPGGHALVWALPRTSHWTATALEDAGFEVRDCLVHVFGSGFPKSMDVSKAMDKAAGAEREVIGERKLTGTARKSTTHAGHGAGATNSADAREYIETFQQITAPATDLAKQWTGWGTALKPASEHWWLVRKPLSGTVAANVQRYGTGALNIDASRVGTVSWRHPGSSAVGTTAYGDFTGGDARTHEGGRWPPNLLLSHSESCEESACDETCAVAELDRQSEERGMHSAGKARDGTSAVVGETYNASSYKLPPNRNMRRLGDSGGASRFFPVFRYQAKPSRKEREAGLDALLKTVHTVGNLEGAGRNPLNPNNYYGGEQKRVEAGLPPSEPRANTHPTVKPIALMEWLVTLVTPPGGVVLDPFMGSGTTGVAAVRKGFRFVGIEREDEYLAIARARIEAA